MAKVTIPYKPRYPEVHDVLESHRFVVLVAHRRFGKTVLSVNHLLKQALLCQRERGSYAYVAPLRNQAKSIAWQYLKHYSAPIPGRMVNESELIIALPNGANIRLFGADNPDALRGLYFDGVILDEVAQMKPEVWEEIVQPALADRMGWALFIGTPKGINLFSRLYDDAKTFAAKGNPDWFSLSFPVTETNALPSDEVERLRAELSDNAFRQEMMCDFAASSDDTLITLDEVNMAMSDWAMDMAVVNQWPLVVGVDVGLKHDPTVIFARRGRFTFEPIIWRELDTVEQAHRLLAYIRERKPAYMCIDVGFNPGVYELLTDLHRHQDNDTVITAINFGSHPNSDRYLNKRVEIWVAVRDWIREGGKLQRNDTLKAELTAPITWRDEKGRIHLEPKDAIKERLGHSTDLADALALTFAVPIGLNPDSVFPEFDTDYGQRAAEKLCDFVYDAREPQERWNPFGGQSTND